MIRRGVVWPRGMREAGLAVLAALLLLASSYWAPGAAFWRRLETATLDLQFRLRGPLPARPDIALVMADDASLARLGRWPFSRHLMADAVDRLDRAGARVILFDQLFFEPERQKPEDLREIARGAEAALGPEAPAALHAALTSLAGDDPDGDFARTIKQSGKVLLPFTFEFGGKPHDDVDLSDAAYQQFDRSPITPEPALDPTAVTAPIPPLREAAAGLGHVHIAYDLDNQPRYEYLALRYQGDYLPAISVRAAASLEGVPWDRVALGLGQQVRIGDLIVPTDAAGRLLINYRGPKGSFATFSFADLLAGQVPDAAMRGRLVILGASFTGNADANANPFASTELPGSERMADAIATMLDRDFIRELPLSRALVAGVLLLALASGLATARLPIRAGVAVGLLPPLVWVLGARVGFGQGWWLPTVQPVAALAAAALSAFLFRYWVTDRERRQIKATFSRYMAPKLVEFLAANPDRVKLGGETRRVTLMFCDVRDFTSISEQFAADPQGLVRLINRFLTAMADIIHAHDGTIDKYIGDCIMAYWNAPLETPRHAELACAAALAMRDGLKDLNAELEAEAKREGRPFLPLKIGIGLNSGDCVLGNMGSAQAVQSFTALGDPVNLASRLEGQSKGYGVDIVIGETTRAAAPDPAAIELDLIAVKGKKQAVRIFALLGDAARAGTDDFARLAAAQSQMLAAYRRQDWPTARAALDAAAAAAPELERLHALFRERIAAYEADPPGPDWDGVHVAKSK